jgi:hypothetical protein
LYIFQSSFFSSLLLFLAFFKKILFLLCFNFFNLLFRIKEPLSLKLSLSALSHSIFFPHPKTLLLELAGDHSSKNCHLKKELLAIAPLVGFMVGKIVYFATVVATCDRLHSGWAFWSLAVRL